MFVDCFKLMVLTVAVDGNLLGILVPLEKWGVNTLGPVWID